MDFDGGEVLGCHRPSPRLLNNPLYQNKQNFITYPLSNLVLPQKVGNFPVSISLMDFVRFSNHSIDGLLCGDFFGFVFIFAVLSFEGLLDGPLEGPRDGPLDGCADGFFDWRS